MSNTKSSLSPRMYLPKLYPSSTIQSRSAARRAAQDIVTPNILDIKPFQLENEGDFQDDFFARFCHAFSLIRKFKKWVYKYSCKKKLKKKYLPTINFQHICLARNFSKSHICCQRQREEIKILLWVYVWL